MVRWSGSAPQGYRGAAGRLGGSISDDAFDVHDTEGLVPFYYEGTWSSRAKIQAPETREFLLNFHTFPILVYPKLGAT